MISEREELEGFSRFLPDFFRVGGVLRDMRGGKLSQRCFCGCKQSINFDEIEAKV